MSKTGKILCAFSLAILVVGVSIYSYFLKPASYSYGGEPPQAISESLLVSQSWITLFDGQSLSGWTPIEVALTDRDSVIVLQ
jgi:hypothetical protein